MTYYRMHETIVSEREFIEDAASWMWDFDDDGTLYERELKGIYSAFEDISDLLDYYDGNGDDTPVAIFEGDEVARPSSDAVGEVLVRPTRLLRWTTISDLRILYVLGYRHKEVGMRVTKQEIDWLNRELLYRGAWLKRYYPGDGVVRYRLVDAKEWANRHDGTLMDIEDGNIPEPDYFSAVAIQTALGSKEARLMVESYIAGWNNGRNA